jgi:hypothetical protein
MVREIAKEQVLAIACMGCVFVGAIVPRGCAEGYPGKRGTGEMDMEALGVGILLLRGTAKKVI